MTDPRDEFGRSDRTQLALAASLLPTRVRPLVAPLLRRGQVAVLHGLAAKAWFPARAVGVGHAQARLLLHGHLEVPVQEALRRTLTPGMVVYDVGANIGFFSVLAARLVGSGGRVVAFEPVPATAALAAEACVRSDVGERVSVRAEAVGAASGTAVLHVAGEAGWSHLAERGARGDTVDTIDVPVVALDDLELPAPDLIKIDVEGSEGDVLRGAARILREARPVLVIELHSTHAEVCDLLDAAGYRYQNLDGPGPVRDGAGEHLLAHPA